MELLDLGRSHENRSLLAVKIGWSKLGEKTPSGIIDGGMHGREFISPATALYIIAQLVQTFKNRESSGCGDSVLWSVEWYVVPLVNPDGYEFSQSGDRFWRKNRRPPGQDEKCPGVDLNRNFHLGYGLGASRDSCSEVFQGPGPGSEPETKALMSLGSRLNTSLLYYVSLHAYGQSWLTPWGFTTESLTSQQDLEAVARAAISEMECSYGRAVPAREYEVGAAADIYYIAGGASDDWFYARSGPSQSSPPDIP